MDPLTFINHDTQDVGPQYLEDLATGYWFSEVLYTAVDTEIFTLLEPEGKTLDEIAGVLNFSIGGLERFLYALGAMGLLIFNGSHYFNTKLSREYLVIDTENYQGDSILWRKELASSWQGLTECLKTGGRVNFGSAQQEPQRLDIIRKYIKAMDCVAKTKVREILPFFEGLSLEGKILDVGAGSGAITAGFLNKCPLMTATFMDLPEVLEYTRELMAPQRFGARASYCQANVLESWPVDKESFDLIILSNIIHAYSETEIPGLLDRASDCLKPEGLLIIHDFFLEHTPEKAALFDLNMFINTYNGRVFSSKWVMQELNRLQLYKTELIPLATDTAVIFAAKDEKILNTIHLNIKTRLIARIKALGFRETRLVSVANIHVPDWADLRCQFGCDHYGKPQCPPHSPSSSKTREVLKDYTWALLMEGEPPTKLFQKRVLQAEKEAFGAGFHKSFAYWAGPCTICDTCSTDGVCRNPRDARPSMESAGIDVFETVRRAGFNLRTLNNNSDFVKYFALLLVE
jgi:predicted metal-binding protein/2-polyprenyl-3-methyl-5-hydroxy-6-metoxy-1,4-benzoquinol methylase